MSQKIESAELRADYRNFPIENIHLLPELVHLNDLSGFNITRPYKRSVIPFLTSLDPSAQESGSVNTVCVSQGSLSGYNTDIFGFSESLKPLIKNRSVKALILGNGGVAQTVKYVLNQLQIPFLSISRQIHSTGILWNDLTPELISQYHLLIQCTPLGMFPEITQLPAIPYEAISSNHIAFDTIYLPEETAFLKACREQGAITQNGLQMLHLQADKAFELWTK